jgi:osmotically-inducible protein OsmY
MHSDSALADLDISTIVEGGRVTIVGSVRSVELKQRVVRVVRGIKGVSSIDNQLVVIEATP